MASDGPFLREYKITWKDEKLGKISLTVTLEMDLTLLEVLDILHREMLVSILSKDVMEMEVSGNNPP